MTKVKYGELLQETTWKYFVNHVQNSVGLMHLVAGRSQTVGITGLCVCGKVLRT